jgi:hypothetical protein
VASEEVGLTIAVLLPLVVFRAGMLHTIVLLERHPLHHAEARGERGGGYPGAGYAAAAESQSVSQRLR